MTERRSVKLSNDEIKGFSLRKEGRYTVEIVKVEEKKGQNAPNYEMYEIEYNVLEAPEGAQKGKIKDWVLLEAYLGSLVQLVKATGFPMPKDESEELVIPTPEELEGKELVVEIVHELATRKVNGEKVPVLDDETGEQRTNASIKRRLSLEQAAKTAAATGRAKAKTRRL